MPAFLCVSNMAELALGAFGAGIAAVQTAEGLRELLAAFEDISHASDDINYFHLETRNFINILDMFCSTVPNSLHHIRKGQRRQRLGLYNSTVKMFDSARKDIKLAAKNIIPQVEDIETLVYKYRIRVRWYWRRSLIAALRLKMERVKTSANLFIGVITCEDLQCHIRELERAKEQVSEALKATMLVVTKTIKID